MEKKNGKGKEYHWNGQLEFEGEYLNGQKWNGEAKKYDKYGYLIFSGKYLNGKKYKKKK